MNFQIKEKLILQISGGKRRSFSTPEVGRTKKLAQCLRNGKVILQSSKKKKKKNDRIFSLA